MHARWRLLGLAASCAGPQAPPDAPSLQREGLVAEGDGVQLAFRVDGVGADTLVALHSGPELSGEVLRPDFAPRARDFFAPLARDFTVIFYDGRGSGHSTAVTDSGRISLAHHVADLEAVAQ